MILRITRARGIGRGRRLPGGSRFSSLKSEAHMPDDEPDYGWSRYAEGGVTVIPVPGDHMGCIRPPALETLAAAIDTALPTQGGVASTKR